MPDLELDIRTVEPRDRHPRIMDTWDELNPGESFLLVVDHDPQPLWYQFEATRTGQFTWDYEESGPELWRLRLGRVEEGRTASSTPPFEDTQEGPGVEFVDIQTRPS